MDKKICTTCKKEKEISDFPKSESRRKYGVGSQCKECKRKKARETYLLPEQTAKRAEYDRARKKTVKKQDPIKERARSALKYAVKMKRIIRKPCEICGKPNACAHHDDYNKPLDVRWLCPRHHSMVHWKK